MSVRAITWAYQQHTGCPTSKAVLVKLADHADKDGYCWPSIRKMTEDTELAERTVRLHLRKLEKGGFITTEFRITEDGQTSNGYTLNVDTPPASDSGGPAPHAGGGGSGCSHPLHESPGHIDEPSIEPSLNLPAGVAPACAAGARRLAKEIGSKTFTTWFGGAEFLDGPPVTIRTASLCKANWVREKHLAALERAFGGEVVVETVV